MKSAAPCAELATRLHQVVAVAELAAELHQVVTVAGLAAELRQVVVAAELAAELRQVVAVAEPAAEPLAEIPSRPRGDTCAQRRTDRLRLAAGLTQLPTAQAGALWHASWRRQARKMPLPPASPGAVVSLGLALVIRLRRLLRRPDYVSHE